MLARFRLLCALLLFLSDLKLVIWESLTESLNCDRHQNNRMIVPRCTGEGFLKRKTIDLPGTRSTEKVAPHVLDLLLGVVLVQRSPIIKLLFINRRPQ